MTSFHNYRSRRTQRELVFSPLAWLKLQFFCHQGDTEIGGFGISNKHNLLYVEDFVTVLQATTAVTVRLDDTAVADFTDGCVDAGLEIKQFLRIWCHTHPGDSPEPSGVDEETFRESFGSCDWAVMFILSRTEKTYARMRFSAGPGGSMTLPVSVDWSRWPAVTGSHLYDLLDRWQKEFDHNVIAEYHLVDLEPVRDRGDKTLNALVHAAEKGDENAKLELAKRGMKQQGDRYLIPGDRPTSRSSWGDDREFGQLDWDEVDALREEQELELENYLEELADLEQLRRERDLDLAEQRRGRAADPGPAAQRPNVEAAKPCATSTVS